jgi:hypothetical protein
MPQRRQPDGSPGQRHDRTFEAVAAVHIFAARGGHGDSGNLSCDRRTRPDSARSRRWCAAVILRRSHLDFREDVSAKSVEELSGLVRQSGGEAGGERRDRGPEFPATSDLEGERDSGQPLLGVHRRVARAADEDAPA